MKAPKLSNLTILEYIQQEQESGIKYEFHNGKIFALAGGSFNHGLLCGNIYTELRNGLIGEKKCKTLNSEIKLYINSRTNNHVFLYPDAMVVCGNIERPKNNQQAVSNPILITEVLSKSTADYDRGDKFYLYRKIPSLQEYVLIEQNKPVVEIYYKKPKTDLWNISRVEGLDKTIHLQSINIDIKMIDLYYDVEDLEEINV